MVLHSSHPDSELRRIRSSDTIEPYRQGDLDELCGLYAIVNAIRLAEYPRRKLSRADSRLLFYRGLKFLERRGYGDAPRVGIGTELWTKLARHLLRYARKIDAAHLLSRKSAVRVLPGEIAAAVAFIEDEVAVGIPVAVELRRALNHYTVVSAYTDDRWTLFDSFGYRWLEKSSLGAQGSGARHVLGEYAVAFIPATADLTD